jgi:hypothetical protein
MLVIVQLLFVFSPITHLKKEAKLTAAMRIVSEWKDYDLEIKTLQKKNKYQPN